MPWTMAWEDGWGWGMGMRHGDFPCPMPLRGMGIFPMRNGKVSFTRAQPAKRSRCSKCSEADVAKLCSKALRIGATLCEEEQSSTKLREAEQSSAK
jgi:hypothetical protein